MVEKVADVIDNILFSDIKKSRIHGNGLFSIICIPQNSILGILDGQYVPWEDKFSIPYEWNAIEKDLLLVRPFKTKYSFINHSRDPNLEIRPNPLRVVAIKDINEGEEMTLDYRKEALSEDYLKGHGATYL